MPRSMPRNVGARERLVKRAGPPARWLGPAVLVCGLLHACGGAPPPPRKPDPYGARVASCIDVDRAGSDAAQGRMLRVPGGPTVLGSTVQERAQARLDYGKGSGPRQFEDESKVRRAYVHDFMLDKTPVTGDLFAEFVASCGVLPPDAESLSQDRWAALAEAFVLPWSYERVATYLWSAQKPPIGRERHPMVLVTQEEAGFYCAWRGARLPTEDEWERAARGPQGRAYPWGDRYDPFRVNTAQVGKGDTIEVGTMPVGDSVEGFSDMGGHVFEWTETPWPGRPGFAVVKGNGWNGRGGYGRGAARVSYPVGMRDITLGFRCAYAR
jgi:formylglycine-generating enzyme required for sulfatase activity